MRFSPVFRTIDILMVSLLIATVMWTFKVKFDSQEALDRVAKLEQQIEAEKNRVDLLKSDWSLLTSPARLEKLVKHYGVELELGPIEPAQLANDNTLPPVKEPESLLGQEKTDGYAGIDEVNKTGSVLDTASGEAR